LGHSSDEVAQNDWREKDALSMKGVRPQNTGSEASERCHCSVTLSHAQRTANIAIITGRVSRTPTNLMGNNGDSSVG